MFYDVYVQEYDRSCEKYKYMFGTKEFPCYHIGYIYGRKIDLDNLIVFDVRDPDSTNTTASIDILLPRFDNQKINLLLGNGKKGVFLKKIEFQYKLIKEDVWQDDVMFGNEYKLSIT